MIKIKNWDKFGNKPFIVLDEVPQKGDHFIFNNDGRIRKCNIITYAPKINRINYSLNSIFCKKIIFDDSVDMHFDDVELPVIKITTPNLIKGDVIYFLYEYDLLRGIVESIGTKNVKIQYSYIGGHISSKYVPFDKVAEPDENICVVWETWRGTNGRGSYRIERELYHELRKKAKNWGFQKYITENTYGRSQMF